MKRKSIRNRLALAALLLALSSFAAPKAHAQIDEFYSSGINGGHLDGFGFGTIDDENEQNIGTWTGFQQDDPTPVGGGLLVLAASGVCYAAFKRRTTTKEKDNIYKHEKDITNGSCCTAASHPVQETGGNRA